MGQVLASGVTADAAWEAVGELQRLALVDALARAKPKRPPRPKPTPQPPSTPVPTASAPAEEQAGPEPAAEDSALVPAPTGPSGTEVPGPSSAAPSQPGDVPTPDPVVADTQETDRSAQAEVQEATPDEGKKKAAVAPRRGRGLLATLSPACVEALVKSNPVAGGLYLPYLFPPLNVVGAFLSFRTCCNFNTSKSSTVSFRSLQCIGRDTC